MDNDVNEALAEVARNISELTNEKSEIIHESPAKNELRNRYYRYQ